MRRDMFVILGITALVVTAVVVLGPWLSTLSFGSPSKTSSIPLAPPESESRSIAAEESEPTTPLHVEVVDAATGRHIERDTAVDLYLEGGDWLDQMRGRADGEPIAFDVPLWATSLMLRARLPGYVTGSIEPVLMQPGLPKLVRFTLTPVYPVRIKLPPGYEGDVRLLRVFSTTVPAWPETRPYSQWHVVLYGSAAFELPPGRYGLQVVSGDPRKHPDYAGHINWVDLEWLNRTPGYAIPVDSSIQEFQVTDHALEITPALDWGKGELSLGGVLLDEDGEPLEGVKLEAIRCGPGPVRVRAATAKSDAKGAFRFEGLSAGVYRVQERDDQTVLGEQAVWLGTLGDEALPQVVLRAEVVKASSKNPTPEKEAEPETAPDPKPEPKTEPEPDPEKEGTHDRPIGGVNIKLPPPTAPPVDPPPPPPLSPPMEKPVFPPPLPPRPPTDELSPEGRTVWLYPAGADEDQLWCAVVHAADDEHVWTEGVAECDELRVSLVRHEGRYAIVVQGLKDTVSSVSLRLPDRDPVRVVLKDDQVAYVVDCE